MLVILSLDLSNKYDVSFVICVGRKNDVFFSKDRVILSGLKHEL